MESQTQKVVTGTLKDVTVFFTGAELKHTVKTNLAEGENEIIVEGLSPHTDINSIKVKTAKEIVVSSFEFSIDHLSSTKTVSPQIQKLTESLDNSRKELQQIEVSLKINGSLIEQLKEGISKNVSGSDKGLGIDDLIKTMDYMKTKSYELEQEKIQLEGKKKEVTESIQKLQNQVRQETQGNDKTSGILKLNLLSPKAGTTDLLVSYFTGQAGWEPSYDIHAFDTDVPVQIRLRANVRQTTGIDWEQIKPTLSSGQPGNGKVAPLFTAWFLRPEAPIRAQRNVLAQNSFSYHQKVQADEMVIEELMAEDVDYAMSPSIQNYVTTHDNALDVHYEIALPYTIPSNGKIQYIDLKTYEAKADYKYYATPKLDKQTYVLAEIPEWEKLGLMSGNANVSYNGTYLGETYLDASSTSDKQVLTLGSDPRVIVKREKIQDFSSRKALGSDLVHQFTYQITVKNNRNQPVKMVVKDQYPLSTQKNIEVELSKKETTPWTAINQEVGVVSWEEEFKAGETKIYRISYSVKYPKDMKLNL